MTNLSDRILTVFLEKQVLLLNDSDISLSLVAQGIPCYTEEIRRHVQTLSPALFHLSFNKNGATTTIHVDPKIDICDAFLAGQCHNAVKSCGKLHLCREFGHCNISNCRYPHNFTRGENRRIVEQLNCQDVNCELIVKLIRLKKTCSSRSIHRDVTVPIQRVLSSQTIDINRQVDVSFPALNLAKQVDMEIIELILNVQDIKIEKKLNENENEYFRRETIQLERIEDVEQLLASSILTHDNVDIKFKRTNQIIDRSNFLLKILMNNVQERLNEARMRLYAAVLVGNIGLSGIVDLSTTTTEQICLVQCNVDIEFDQVRHQYQSRPQLQGKDVSLIQIYQCDAVTISYMDENKTMKYDDIQLILRSVWKDIFAFNFPTEKCVDVEFMNVNVYKQWMSTTEKIKEKFHITVNPIINTLDDKTDIEITSSAQNIPFNITTSSDDQPQQTKIILRSEWTMVAAHPLFKLEYKDYIKNELGGTIDIHGSEIIYTGSFPKLLRRPTNEAILANRTNNYMQKLKYQTLHDLKPFQVDILRAHSSTVAFNRIHRKDYAIAAMSNELYELRNKLFPKTNQRLQSDHVYSRVNHQSNDASPTPPLMRSEPIERPISPSLSTSFCPITAPEQVSMFSINTFEDRLRQHLEEIYNVKILIERNHLNEQTRGEKPHIIIKITGQQNDVESTSDDLLDLFCSLRTRKFHDKTDGNWTKMKEATQVIQYHFTLINLICTCQQISSTSVHVNYFDIKNPQFGVDEQKIDDLINNTFSSATITYNQQSSSSKFSKDWIDLEDNIRTRDDYTKDICLYKETTVIYLFGLTKLVKEFHQAFEQLKNKHLPVSCKITLSDKQLNYLTYVAIDDVNNLEKQYKMDGCDVSLTRLRQTGDFLAPPDMHSTMKDNIEALAQIDEIIFEVNSVAFEVLINKEPEILISLVKSKCYLEKQVQTHRTYIPIPQAQVDDLEDLVQQSQNASGTNSTSINIGHSTITIVIGDLTAQAVDMIVVCSTSEILRESIIAKAGPQVQAAYDSVNSNTHQACATPSGTLPCKRILFLPWRTDSSDTVALKKSLSIFVLTAISHASKNKYTSVAFPSIGCGKLGFDPSIIAKHMIDETEKQLTINDSKLDISFILLSDQQNVYDEFVLYLNRIKSHDSTKLPKIKANPQQNIPYDEKIIKITLISSNKNHLIKCKHDILQFSRSLSVKSQLTDKRDMIGWSQKTINEYYRYCLKQHVLPTLDFDKLIIELIGPKDAVHEAEKYFYELTTETYKQAHIHAVSRGVIWSVEVTPDSDAWEQYSFQLNGNIEDAYLKKLTQVEVVNDKQEKCRVDFSLMEEQYLTNVRRIRRKVVDSSLPDTWESSDQNCKRVTLQIASQEYQTVLQRFDATMQGHYTQIVKIERIQNERWYKQYAAHRDDYKRRSSKLDERLLFHGCLGSSSNEIVQKCFNRSFAGVNGVAYGGGVYFHSHASYSHSYAKPSVSEERTMFLVRVLIGKTCVGNPTMIVPPTGSDTTTDGQHIFVIYHDAGAYADHLITYK